MKRGFLIILFMAIVCGSCRDNRHMEVRSVRVAAVEQIEGDAEGIPESITLAVDVANKGVAAMLRSGRVRISYKGRRVLMFNLEERVRIPRRYEGEVMVPLKVSMARNSQMLSLRSALLRHDAGDMSIDWEVVGRSGVAGARIVQPCERLSEVLSESMLATLWQITDAALTDGNK